MAAVVEQCWHRVPGGTATATVDTLRSLLARGDVQLVGVAAAHRRPPSVALPAALQVRSVPMPRRVLYDVWNHWRRPAVSRFVGGVDVVHSTGGVVPPRGRAALVATVHDLAFVRHPEWFTRRGARFAVRAFELARAEADIVIVPSRSTARDCVEQGVASDRIRVAPWGASAVPIAAEAVEAVRSRYRLPETFALWAGTAEPRKNLPGLLAAVSRTDSRVPLVLAGPRGWGLELRALINEHPAAEVVRAGYVPPEDLAALYTAARVFVYPSLEEGFGLPVLEAMAQGTPVVASATTATAEVCADPASTVDPADVEALAAAIDLAVLDEAEHARRSEAARRRAAELTWDRTAARVRSAYLEACR